ncbi:mRNA capping enzyme [Trichuris trichiura]|uniref:mRNA-capping enzyme n=1 Tax=Trichuris trichiura TaxID=36087 RepID=A0A077YZB8_TRITR|nr:mRNA capping enzyme [Trichuris trichiura]
MSKRSWSQANSELGPPGRWLHCPRKGKTPLGHRYDQVVPEENRFYPSMALKGGGDLGDKEIGLWIDLTNTRRFYDKEEIEDAGVEYVKLNCKGYGECPSEEQVQQFINICKNFSKRSDKIVGILFQFVLLLHSVNVGGFSGPLYAWVQSHRILDCILPRHREKLQVSFHLAFVRGRVCVKCIQVSWIVVIIIDAAIAAFVSARPPGIYKQEYLKELYRRYDDVAFAPDAPELPEWCLETVNYVRKACREYCNYKKYVYSYSLEKSFAVLSHFYFRKDFPGSQPISLDRDNINLLQMHPYMVSWKADGTRYLMFIDGKHRTFLIDRDNNVFVAPTLTFLLPGGDTSLTRTLVDGELVFDVFAGQKTPRYLIYDVIAYCGDLVRERLFHDRHEIIRKRIIGPRTEALSSKRIVREREPFGIRQKPFFELSCIEKVGSNWKPAERLFLFEFKVLSMDVSHETDGVVLQRVDEPYVGGRCPTVLKWKPSSLNSVDFLLRIEKERRPGFISQYVGKLMVLDSKVPFDNMPVTKDLLKYNNKIIECSVVDGVWTFIRERTDKSFPNSYETASGVRKSIRFPITKDDLIHFVKAMSLKYRLLPGSFVALEAAPSSLDTA